MTRPLLSRFIAQVGIVDASILLRRHVIALERMVSGVDEIPQSLAEYLKRWEGSQACANQD